MTKIDMMNLLTRKDMQISSFRNKYKSEITECRRLLRLCEKIIFKGEKPSMSFQYRLDKILRKLENGKK